MPDPLGCAMDKRERKIVLLTSTVHGMVHMQMLAFAAVNLLMAKELGVSVTVIGLVGTVSYFLFGLGALPAGFVIDAIGARRVVALCTAGLAAANVLIAVSPDPLWAILGLALMGISGSVYHPAGLGLISRNVRNTGVAMGLHGTFGNIGLALGPLSAGFVASMFGWRWAYLWLAAPMAFMALTYMNTRFGDVREEEIKNKTVPSKQFTKGFLSALLLVIVLQSTSGFIYRASITFMPAHSAAAIGDWLSGLDPTARGGLLTGVIFLAGAVGQLLAGWLSTRMRTEALQLILACLVAPLLAAFGLLSGFPMMATGMAFAFIFFGLQPLGNTLVAKYSPEGLRGRSYGLSFFLSFGIGAFGSGFAGYIGESQGFAVTYLWLAALGLVSILLAATILLIALKRGGHLSVEEKIKTGQV